MCQEALQAVGFTGPGSYQLPKVLPNSDSEKKQQQKTTSSQSQSRAPDCRRVIRPACLLLRVACIHSDKYNVVG